MFPASPATLRRAHLEARRPRRAHSTCQRSCHGVCPTQLSPSAKMSSHTATVTGTPTAGSRRHQRRGSAEQPHCLVARGRQGCARAHVRVQRVLAAHAGPNVAAVAAQVPPLLPSESLPPPRTQWWKWRGYDIRYTCAGVDNDGPSLVLVHGFGGNADHWRKNVGPLAACGYRVFALDLLGYGYSSKPAPSEEVPNTVYNFETWGEQLADFCNQVVGTHAFLVSNSVGGIAALQCAVAAPDCCRGVVLMNVSLRGLHITKQLPFMRPLVATFQRTLRTSSLGKAFFANIAQASTVRAVLREAYGDKAAVTDELVDKILSPGLQPGATAVFLDFISYSTGPLAEELLPQMKAPVLTIWGEADPWEEVAKARQLYTPEAVPGVVEAFVTLAGVGHCPQDEAPQLVNPLVADWVARTAGRGQ